MQAGILHRAIGIGFEAGGVFFFGIASFPICIDKFLRSKVQNTDVQTYFSHKADVCNLQKVPAEGMEEWHYEMSCIFSI